MRGERLYWIGLGVAAVLAAWIHSHYLLRGGGTSADEVWMIQVTGRLLAGELLYRDVFCGTTPLAFYLQAGLAAIWGNEVWLLRVVLHTLFAATLVLTARIGTVLQVPRALVMVGVAGLTVWLRPIPNSSYSAWALLFFLGVMHGAASLESTERPRRVALIAGVLAGLAFATKYNAGVLALAPLLLTVVLVRRQGWLRQALLAVTGFLVAALAPLLAVFHSGAGAWFVSQCLTGKTVYLRQGGLSYMDQLTWSPGTILYLLPICLPVLLLECLRKGRRGASRVGIVLMFGLAGLAAVYPRPDPLHMRLAAPGLALAAVFCLSLLTVGRRVRAGMAVAACLGAAGYYGLRAARELQHGPHEKLQAAGLRGVSMRKPDAHALLAESQALLANSPAAAVLILHTNASLYYLLTGLKNPTRYDFPLLTPFGPHGQQGVIESIRQGKIRAVCMDTGAWEMLPPVELLRFVREHLHAGKDAGPCRMFTAGADLVQE